MSPWTAWNPQASTRFRMKKGGNYDPERNKSYLDTDLWRVVDCGDCDYVPGDLTATNKIWEMKQSHSGKAGDYAYRFRW